MPWMRLLLVDRENQNREKCQFQVSACDGRDKRISRLKDGIIGAAGKFSLQPPPAPGLPVGITVLIALLNLLPETRRRRILPWVPLQRFRFYYARRVLLLLET